MAPSQKENAKTLGWCSRKEAIGLALFVLGGYQHKWSMNCHVQQRTSGRKQFPRVNGKSSLVKTGVRSNIVDENQRASRCKSFVK